MAYLIGLLRSNDPQTHQFLLEECLGLKDQRPLHGDSSTWSTAIGALGRIADQSDAPILVEIARGRRQGTQLEKLFTNPTQRNYLRQEAITALANLGGLDLLDAHTREELASDPA